MTLPSHYREEAEREIRSANLPKLLAVAERVRVAIQQSEAVTMTHEQRLMLGMLLHSDPSMGWLTSANGANADQLRAWVAQGFFEPAAKPVNSDSFVCFRLTDLGRVVLKPEAITPPGLLSIDGGEKMSHAADLDRTRAGVAK